MSISVRWILLSCISLSAPGTSLSGQITGMMTVIGDGGAEVAHSSDLVPQGGITLEAWVYVDLASGVPGSFSSILRKDNGGIGPLPSYLFRTVSVGGPLQAQFLTQSGFHSVMATTMTPPGLWHHVAFTYDGNDASLYLNGDLVGTLANSGPSFPGQSGILRIGDGHGSAQDSWKGSLDNVRIWNYARTPAELASTMFAQLGAGPGIVAEWRFDGGYTDSAGNHDATPSPHVTLSTSTSPVQDIGLFAPALGMIGSTIDFAIGTASPGEPYAFDVSLTGTEPVLVGPFTGATVIRPPLLHSEFGSFFPQAFTNFIGFLDAAGDANPRLYIPDLPSLVGLTLNAQFVRFDPTGPLLVATFSEPTATLLVEPSP